jgi:ribonuclease Z
MILTTSDVVASAMENAKAAIKPAAKQNAKGATKPAATENARAAIKPESSSRDNSHGIDVIGPSGTQKFMLSLRHFMRRDAFEVRVREGSYFQNSGEKIKKRKQKGTGNEGSFHVQSIACVLENSEESILHPRKRLRTEGSNQVLSFVFTTPPIQGKFLVDKAKALGIPPGPLYAQLKSGKSIKFQNKQGEEQTVESAEVVEPGSPGVAIAVLYYPTLEVCEQLCASEALNKFKQRSSEEAYLELIVHMAPRDSVA